MISTTGMSSVVSYDNLNADEVFTQAFENKLENLQLAAELTSISIAVVFDNEIVYQKGFGEQDNIDTIFRIGCVTKALTAMNLLRFYDQELFMLDDNAMDYLPDLVMNIVNPNFPTVNVTFRQLLSHTSSMIMSAYYPDNPLAWDPNNPPGDCFNYSNQNYWVLTKLIEEFSNSSFQDHMMNVFFPLLEMTNTSFDYTDFPLGQLADGYSWDNVTKDKSPISKDNNALDLYIGGGGAMSRASDLANFLMMHKNNGNYKGNQILKEETVNLMHSDEINCYGLGWISDFIGFVDAQGGINALNITNLTGIGGTAPGWTSELYYQKNEDTAVVMCSNLRNFDDFELKKNFYELFYHIFDTSSKLQVLTTTTTTIEPTTSEEQTIVDSTSSFQFTITLLSVVIVISFRRKYCKK